MPLVRMLTSVAGSTCDWTAGEVVNMTEAEAAVWADGERGVLVEERVATPERGGSRAETRPRRR